MSAPDVTSLAPGETLHRQDQTRQAFDALASGYDRSEESNQLLLRLRHQWWRVLLDLFPPGSRLLDLGCGTGIDAAYLASHGRRIVATDLSEAMVRRARERAAQAGVDRLVTARRVAIEDLSLLAPDRFDGIVANRGPLNCVDDLPSVATSCARLLPPGGYLVATVIGRWCPWEMLYYAWRGEWRRAALRLRPGFVPVPLQGQVVATRYLTPRELAAAFAVSFRVVSYRGLGQFLPPTYLAPLADRHPRLTAAAARLDQTMGAWPGLRHAGDLFLMVLARHG